MSNQKINNALFEVIVNDKFDNHIKIKRLDYLIKLGADVNALIDKAYIPYTPLMIASNRGDLEMMDYLISKGADVNMMDNDGYNALIKVMTSEASNKIEVVKKLLDSGADINFRAGDGTTALIRAVYFKNTELVRFLIDNGALVDVSDSRGDTALHQGVIMGAGEDIINLLIENGANPLRKNHYGSSVMDLAYGSTKNTILKALKNKVRKEKKEKVINALKKFMNKGVVLE
jgi:ankyrin repeat protein